MISSIRVSIYTLEFKNFTPNLDTTICSAVIALIWFCCKKRIAKGAYTLRADDYSAWKWWLTKITPKHEWPRCWRACRARLLCYYQMQPRCSPNWRSGCWWHIRLNRENQPARKRSVSRPGGPPWYWQASCPRIDHLWTRSSQNKRTGRIRWWLIQQTPWQPTMR